MEIKAKSKFDFETMKDFAHFSAFKKANPKKRFIMWSILSFLLAAIVVLE